LGKKQYGHTKSRKDAVCLQENKMRLSKMKDYICALFKRKKSDHEEEE
jgi:hypothetical protein